MTAAQPGRRRPRAVVWVLACVVLAAAGVGVVAALRGGGASTASAADPLCKPRTPRTSACPDNTPFHATSYVGHGDAFDCIDFARQADAQAVLRADPRDPDVLDPDRDGVACPTLPPPRDATPVASITARFRCRPHDPRSRRCPQPSRAFHPGDYAVYLQSDAYDCTQFASQADAQAVLRFAPSDPNRLDADGDGIACPDLPAPKDPARVPRTPPS